MAQASLYLLSMVDVRRATQPSTSRAIIIPSLTMPALKLKTAAHDPGGGVGEVNYVMPRIEAPEPAFNAKGIDEEVFTGFGEVDRWTFAGAYSKRGPGGSRAVPGRSIIEGAVNGWEPDESDPAEFQGCTHSFAEVTHYEFLLDGKELFYWDSWERVLRMNGVDLTAKYRQALGA